MFSWLEVCAEGVSSFGDMTVGFFCCDFFLYTLLGGGYCSWLLFRLMRFALGRDGKGVGHA